MTLAELVELMQPPQELTHAHLTLSFGYPLLGLETLADYPAGQGLPDPQVDASLGPSVGLHVA